MAVVIETTIGDITVDLFTEERPRACLNFIKLCKLKYYNYNLFHTIERDFIAQTGDPTGAGDGGESIWGVVEGPHKRFFEAESVPKIKHSVPGLLSLVSVGKFMVGSQFFFTLGADLTSLDGVHCVIGEVVEGQEVLRKLNEAIVDEKFRPFQDIRVTHTVILDDPFGDPRGFQVPSRSPSPSAERMKNGRIGADEDIDDTQGKTVEEIQEMLAEREAKARATILEIVGDLPDADIAPPENVLFVCKLNPVTTDDDLEIIFSRFGKVKSCEVIRDRVTGDSLQYAFVEFEDQKACEAAYFKMDNVLIDDRRIHVDFSQSVSKVQWRGKGRLVVDKNGKDRKLDFNNLREKKGDDRRTHRDRSRSPVRRNDKNNRSDQRRQKSNNRRSSPARGSPSSRRRSSDRDYREDKRTDRRHIDDDKRSPYRRGRQSPHRRQYPDRRPPANGDHYPDRKSQESFRERRNDDKSYRQADNRNRDPTSSRSRNERRDGSERSSNRNERRDASNERSAIQHKNRGPQKSHSKKDLKARKKHEKSRKRKKSETSSSSSSESESESSSSTSSSSSSSTTPERRKKKVKKTKKKSEKTKKRHKKKTKRRHSSSSSD